MNRIKTEHHKSVFSNEEALDIFADLRDHIPWTDSIRSTMKNKITRKGYSLEIGDSRIVYFVVTQGLKRLGIENHVIYGIYLNYYRDGSDFAPNHSHKSKQIVFVFNEPGGQRDFLLNKKIIKADNGDCIIFGKSMHGVPEAENKKGRISVALFADEMPEKGNGDNYFVVSSEEDDLNSLSGKMDNVKL